MGLTIRERKGVRAAPRVVAREIPQATTIEKTSKHLKSHIAMAVTVMLFSFMGGCVSVATDGKPVVGGVLFLLGMIGLGWLIVTQIRIWWHHG